MNQYPSTRAEPEQGSDEQLRQRLQDALSRPERDGLQALQDRVLAQWKTAVATTTPVVNGPVAALGLHNRPRSLRWAGAVLALLLVIGWQWGRNHADGSLRDLMEPDVLSMMVLGEL